MNDAGSASETLWFARGVGLVKRSWTEGRATGHWVLVHHESGS